MRTDSLEHLPAGTKPAPDIYYMEATVKLEQSPLYPVFLLIAAEYERSLTLHKPWSESNLSVQAMHKAAFGELAEVDLAIAMEEDEEVITEFVHVANVACKSIQELTRRKGGRDDC